MKSSVVLLFAAFLSIRVMAQTAPSPAPTTPQATPPPAAKSAPSPSNANKVAIPAKATNAAKTVPTTKAPATTTKAAAKTAKTDEPPAKIDGVEIGRGAKGFLGLQVVDGNFKLSFYDAKKKPSKPDVIRAVLRWTPSYKPGTEIYVLGPGDGKSLTVAKTVRPPYTFKLFMSLFVEGADDPVETYVVDFSQ